jgi:hypothetical protein
MKTICPHCKQEFPEIPDEYLGMTLQCSVCEKEFVCEKPKFCIACGNISHANAIKCSGCGSFFQQIPQQPVTVQKDFTCRNIEEETKVPWYKRPVFVKKEKVEYEANSWGLLAIFLSIGVWFFPILWLPALIYALFVRAAKGQRYLAIAIVVFRMIVNVVFVLPKLM